jgi:hypothetical protein
MFDPLTIVKESVLWENGMKKFLLVFHLFLGINILLIVPRSQAQAPIEQFRQICAQFGFAIGTSEHAQCVERQFNQSQQSTVQRNQENQGRLQSACRQIQQQAQYWCAYQRNGGGFQAGMNCSNYENQFRQSCM